MDFFYPLSVDWFINEQKTAPNKEKRVNE